MLSKKLAKNVFVLIPFIVCYFPGPGGTKTRPHQLVRWFTGSLTALVPLNVQQFEVQMLPSYFWHTNVFFSSTIAQVYKVWKFRSWSLYWLNDQCCCSNNCLRSEQVSLVLLKTVPHNKSHFCPCVTNKCSYFMTCSSLLNLRHSVTFRSWPRFRLRSIYLTYSQVGPKNMLT